tara:strand:- start:2581 stop:2958 length:378 start_codon:yes stop_codon:yes gene_type:complete
MLLWGRAEKFYPMANSKKRYENRKYLEYVAQKPCCLTKAGVYSHSHGVQVHHLLKPWSGVRGMGLRAGDQNSIPLCFHHHQMLHTKFGSEAKFFKSFGLHEDFGQQEAKRLWEEYNDEVDTDLPF